MGLEGVIVSGNTISNEPQKTLALGAAWQDTFNAKPFDSEKTKTSTWIILVIFDFIPTFLRLIIGLFTGQSPKDPAHHLVQTAYPMQHGEQAKILVLRRTGVSILC